MAHAHNGENMYEYIPHTNRYRVIEERLNMNKRYALCVCIYLNCCGAIDVDITASADCPFRIFAPVPITDHLFSSFSP